MLDDIFLEYCIVMSTLGVEIWTPLYSFVNNTLRHHEQYEISNLNANATNLEWVTYSYNNTHTNTTRNTM